MQNTAHPRTPARTRTWEVVVDDRPYGEYWGSTTHLVTMTRDASTHGGFRAVINGRNADVRRAGQLLESARKRTILHEELMEEVAA